jgi:hypothetical protein
MNKQFHSRASDAAEKARGPKLTRKFSKEKAIMRPKRDQFATCKYWCGMTLASYSDVGIPVIS